MSYMLFSARMTVDTLPVYEGILAQPFITELAAGTLAQAAFARYLQQDALYLKDYARALNLLAAKAPDGRAYQTLAGFGTGALVVERVLHEQFFTGYGIAPTQAKSRACVAYTSYLLATCALEPFGVGMAAVLPCFRLYQDVGVHIHSMALPGNPYAAWIDTYAAPEFATLTAQAEALADAAYAEASIHQQKDMRQAYHTAADMEAWFWKSAY